MKRPSVFAILIVVLGILALLSWIASSYTVADNRLLPNTPVSAATATSENFSVVASLVTKQLETDWLSGNSQAYLAVSIISSEGRLTKGRVLTIKNLPLEVLKLDIGNKIQLKCHDHYNSELNCDPSFEKVR